jgi:hypothetical protein
MSKIYHYTKLNTAIEFILPSMTLRTNFLNKMNGPKENQKWSFGGINIDYEGMYPETYSDETHIKHQEKLGGEIKSKIQALCFVHSDKYKGYENEMMWAQYSENHKGVCLEFDTELLIEENKHIDIFKFENISYDLKENVSLYWDLSLSKEENIDNIIKRHFKLLFLSKSHYWEKEFEKRLMIIDNNLCKLKINKSLTGIYYGLSTNYHYDIAIEQFINKEQTKIYKVFYEKNKLKRMEKRKI